MEKKIKDFEVIGCKKWLPSCKIIMFIYFYDHIISFLWPQITILEAKGLLTTITWFCVCIHVYTFDMLVKKKNSHHELSFKSSKCSMIKLDNFKSFQDFKPVDRW